MGSHVVFFLYSILAEHENCFYAFQYVSSLATKAWNYIYMTYSVIQYVDTSFIATLVEFFPKTVKSAVKISVMVPLTYNKQTQAES